MKNLRLTDPRFASSNLVEEGGIVYYTGEVVIEFSPSRRAIKVTQHGYSRVFEFNDTNVDACRDYLGLTDGRE